MSDCHKTRDLFSLIHENESSRQETGFFDSHLASCAACRDEWMVFVATQNLVTTLPRLVPSEDFEDRVLYAVRAAQREERVIPPLRIEPAEPRWWEGWIPRFALAGAAAAVVVMTFLGSMGHVGTTTPVPNRMSAAALPAQPVVQRLEDRFPDLPPEVLRSLDEESYVLDKMTVQPATSRGRARVVAPVVDESHGPVYVTF